MQVAEVCHVAHVSSCHRADGNRGQGVREHKMAVYSFEGKTPQVGPETYVHPSADVFGDVTLGGGCWVGPGAARTMWARELLPRRQTLPGRTCRKGKLDPLQLKEVLMPPPYSNCRSCRRLSHFSSAASCEPLHSRDSLLDLRPIGDVHARLCLSGRIDRNFR